MKNTNVIVIIAIFMCIPLQKGCAQDSPCPTDNEQAKQEVINYFSSEKNIESMQEEGMAVNENTKDNIISLTGEAHEEECKQLNTNLDWLQDQQHYSIYKVANQYYIVLYSFTDEGKFQKDEIAIINSKFEAVGSIIDIGKSN